MPQTFDMTDPGSMRTLAESHEREAMSRMGWAKKNVKFIEEAATFRRPPKNYTTVDIAAAVMTAGMPMTSRDNIEAARHRFKQPAKEYESKTEEEITPMMKPVSDDEKALLSESSVLYLKKRNQLAPADKYNFMICTSWAHGWHRKRKHVYGMNQEPSFGKKNDLLQALESRVGPQPDPPYYKVSELSDRFHRLCML